MKKKMNLTAIIAVVMVAMSATWLTSCTADDEYGDFSFGTLANGMFTRSGGDPGWGETTPAEGESDSQDVWVEGGNDTHVVSALNIRFEFKIVWDSDYAKSIRPKISLNKFYNGSPEITYIDDYNIEHRTRVYEFLDCIFETPMNMGGNQFRCVAKVYYKWAIKVQNSNNPYKYRFVETYEIINIDYNIDKDGIKVKIE